MTPAARRIAEAIKDLRAHMQASQQELSNHLGLAVRTVARYETEAAPKGTVLLRLKSIAQQYGREDIAARFEAETSDSQPRRSQISNAVLQLRAALDLTQEALATMTGIAVGTIARAETGADISAAVLTKLALFAKANTLLDLAREIEAHQTSATAVQQLRLALGPVSQQELARRTGLSRSTISKVERGHTTDIHAIGVLAATARDHGLESIAEALEKHLLPYTKIIINLRKQLGDSKKAFARRLGVPEVWVTRYETGTIPKRDVMWGLATLAEDIGLTDDAATLRHLETLNRLMSGENLLPGDEVNITITTEEDQPKTAFEELGAEVYSLVKGYRPDLLPRPHNAGLPGTEFDRKVGLAVADLVVALYRARASGSAEPPNDQPLTQTETRHYFLNLPSALLPRSLVLQTIATQMQDLSETEREQLLSFLKVKHCGKVATPNSSDNEGLAKPTSGTAKEEHGHIKKRD